MFLLRDDACCIPTSPDRKHQDTARLELLLLKAADPILGVGNPGHEE